jgi:hypothetical protein
MKPTPPQKYTLPQTAAQAAKLEGLRSGATLVTAEERAAVERRFVAAMDAWRKRRGIFRGVWDAVSEGMEGKQADLFEEIGVWWGRRVGWVGGWVWWGV